MGCRASTSRRQTGDKAAEQERGRQVDDVICEALEVRQVVIDGATLGELE